MLLTVGISEMRATSNPGDVLVTYSLGSCIGLGLYDPVARIGGLVHCMLPLSKIDPDRARENPAMFTDTGVPALLEAVLNLGADKSRLLVKVAGAAHLLDDRQTFRIGERNKMILRKVLWRNDLLIAAEDTGGTIARTMTLRLNDGLTTIRSGGQQYELQ